MKLSIKNTILFLILIFGSNPIFAQQFTFDIVVSDNLGNSTTLTIGMNPAGTAGYDSGLDIKQPPPPPAPAFDARLIITGDELQTDIRLISTDETIYRMDFIHDPSASNMTLSWNMSKADSLGAMEVQTLAGATLQDMTTNASYTFNTTTPILTISMTVTEDITLPVSLMNFSASGSADGVQLLWSTASEIQNLGFEIYRSAQQTGGFQLIGSYENNPDLRGAGTTNVQNDYAFTDPSATSGETYWYRLADVDFSGVRTLHAPISVIAGENSGGIPQKFALAQNFPNPFNPGTTIRFELPEAANVNLSVFNLLGEKVAEVLSRNLPAGTHQTTWDAGYLPGGVYFYQLQTPKFTATRKMILLK
ncbi:MAG: T9SS type A sorting domain-containing protein [Calditrichia bacterium]